MPSDVVPTGTALSCNVLQVEDFTEAVRRHYWYEFFADKLPIWGFVGPPPEQIQGDTNVYIYTHKSLDIAYNGDRVRLGPCCLLLLEQRDAFGNAAGLGCLTVVLVLWTDALKRMCCGYGSRFCALVPLLSRCGCHAMRLHCSVTCFTSA
jgi:hypothetical protein